MTARVYDALVERFTSTGTPFREITHRPAAAVAEYHVVVGSRLEQQAKALLFRRYRPGGGNDYLVMALPGDQRADLLALRAVAAAEQPRLATHAELHNVTGCRFGELPPVGSIFGLQLVLDDRLASEAELFFNAGRLDRSLIVQPRDLIALKRPTIMAPPTQEDPRWTRQWSPLPQRRPRPDHTRRR
jgi:Ala-tRNA(Pro) deacylase